MLDAPVLARGVLTLFLLHLADAGAFDPVWSDQIHIDWTRKLQFQRANIPPDRLRQRRFELDRGFPVANVIASRDAQDEVLAHCTTQAERKSAHVLATALSARAAVIVTDASFCLTEVMSKVWHDIAVLSPDAWCLELLDRHAPAVLEGSRAHRASLANPDASTVRVSPVGGTASGGATEGGATMSGSDKGGSPENRSIEGWLALLRDPRVGLIETADRLATLRDQL